MLLPGLTVRAAAATHDPLVAVVAAVLAGGVILFPSLALLFALVLRGTFDRTRRETPRPPAREVMVAWRAGLLGRLALVFLLVGVGLTTVADAAWAHAIGVPCLLAFVACAFPVVLAPEIRRR